MRSRLAILLLVPFAAAAAERPLPPLPGLGPHVTRTTVDRDAFPWRAIGRVQTELGTRCTGFLLAPALVATAAHCLWLPEVAHDIRPEHVHFLRGVGPGGFRAHARVFRFVVSPLYDPRREAETLPLDRAFLALATPAGSAADVLAVAATLPPPGTEVALAGYGQDREELLVADLHCHLLGVANGVIRHDCAATRGASGAPLLAQVAPGQWRVLGIEVAADDSGPGGLAVSLVPPAR